MISDIVLDHVAVAAERLADLAPRYGHDLSGRWVSGGLAGGFSAYQFGYSTPVKVEAIEPAAVEENDFLRRFLDRQGPGPHHLTFLVADLRAALAEVDGAGYGAVNVQIGQGGLDQAFLHPREALGVVVQLIRRQGPYATPEPPGFPTPRDPHPAELVHVTHAVDRLDAALRLFSDVLGGKEARRGVDAEGSWLDLEWPGPGRIRLLEPGDPGGAVAAWLGGRPGRIHHLAFRVPRPAELPGARPGPGGYEVPPELNHGTRLRLLDPGA